ncbi:hypothetical protein QJS04_geneDACA010604 [Acorus gramineus]|uniref:Uncharacterized protein n=1 Tax=Acorus gramineus TaxID=55184 RepID=A0AAV9AKJ0_ACOGR|nr:hypothetical protein QJS04_geneDACA010604 [Acorus gramineus]
MLSNAREYVYIIGDHDVVAEGRSLTVRLYDVDYQDPTANPGHDPKTKGDGRGGGVIQGKKKYKP